MTSVWIVANITLALACIILAAAVVAVAWIGVSRLIRDERVRRRERRI